MPVLLALLFASLLLELAASVAHAQAFPTRPIRIIVPLAAGGAFDIFARQFGDKLREKAGQATVVENRPGGNMVIGANACRTAPPDGYTICMLTQNPTTLYPLLYAKPAYDPDTDLTPVMAIGFQQQTLVIGRRVPARDFEGFISYSRRNPDKVNYASIGVGSDSHLILEWLKRVTDTHWTHIPYNGLVPIVAAFAAGDVQVSLLTSGGIRAQIESGDLKPILSRGERRNPLYPSVPSFAEAGLPPLRATSFLGFFGPAGIPSPTLARLRDVLSDVLNDPDFQDRVVIPLGLEPSPLAPSAFGPFLREDRAAWAPLVRSSGVHLQ